MSQRASFRIRLGEWVESTPIQRFVIAVILLNAVVMGLETSPAVMEAAGGALVGIDTACLAVFVVEIGLKLTAFGWRFFRDPWNVFDFLVVAVALVPAGAGFEVLRTLRVLRVLRLISALPQLRKVVGALLSAIPGILSTGALLAVIFYVAGVMATTFFRESMPEYFGTMGASLFSLFQIATLSSWETIVRPAMDEHPWAWMFFIPFIILAAFTALNLIIAVIVDAMNTLHDMPSAQPGEEPDSSGTRNSDGTGPAEHTAAADEDDPGTAHTPALAGPMKAGAVGDRPARAGGTDAGAAGDAEPRRLEELQDEVRSLREEITSLSALLRTEDLRPQERRSERG